jgi:hypothetical protein
VVRARIRLAEAADLAPVCVCCGQPATRVREQEFPLSEALSAGLLAASALCGVGVLVKRAITLALPVCEYHRRRGRRSNRTFFRGLLLTVGLGVAAYLAAFIDDAACTYLALAAVLASIVTMVVAMHETGDGLKVTALAGEWLTLGGVSKEFAAAVGEGVRPSGK